MYLINLIFSLSLFGQIPQEKTEVKHDFTIVIHNVKSDEGQVLINLFNSEETFLKKAYSTKVLDAEEGSISFTFENLPAGNYTAFALHDKNSNGKLDMSKLGIPNEPYGMSKDGKNRFGPPNFEKSVFTVDEINNSLEIKVN